MVETLERVGVVAAVECLAVGALVMMEALVMDAVAALADTQVGHLAMEAGLGLAEGGGQVGHWDSVLLAAVDLQALLEVNPVMATLGVVVVQVPEENLVR